MLRSVRPLALALLAAVPAAVQAVPPAAPADLTVVSPSNGRFTITWQDNSSDESGFVLQVRVPPATGWGSIGSPYLPNVQSATISGGSLGVFYEFRVLAINAANESSPSNIGYADLITSPEFAEIRVDTPFTYQIGASHAESVASYEATPLPPGLTVDENSGLISGTVSIDGHFPVEITARYADPLAPPARNRLELRLIPVPAPPKAIAGTVPFSVPVGSAPLTLDLDTRFEDPDTREAVRFDTSHGAITVSLFDRAAPVPVASFLHYVDASAYSDNIFHRSVNGSSFDIVQSGSFSQNGLELNAVPTVAPIVNSPGIPNDRGTLALARTSIPDSATSGWYFNVQDSPGLDSWAGTGGGYSVFGRTTDASLSILDTLFAFPTVATSFVVDGVVSSGAFSTTPTTDGNAPNGTNLLVVQKVVRIPALRYSLASNSRPGVASAAIIDNELRITPILPGGTDIGITAIDIDGNVLEESVPVNVMDSFAHWSTSHANGATAYEDNEPDGMVNALEYALGGEPTISDTTAILPRSGMIAAGESEHLTLTFAHLAFTADLNYIVEASADLETWNIVWQTSDGFAHPDVVGTTELEDKTQVTIRDPAPITPGEKMHLRLRLEINAPPEP